MKNEPHYRWQKHLFPNGLKEHHKFSLKLFKMLSIICPAALEFDICVGISAAFRVQHRAGFLIVVHPDHMEVIIGKSIYLMYDICNELDNNLPSCNYIDYWAGHLLWKSKYAPPPLFMFFKCLSSYFKCNEMTKFSLQQQFKSKGKHELNGFSVAVFYFIFCRQEKHLI